MDWTFIYLMLALKIPIVGLLWIVWWAIKQAPEDAPADSGNGGTKRPPHPRRPKPRTPRRGPHGEPALPAPPRVRKEMASHPPRHAPSRD